ncbi:MAG: hypothetical protein AAB834_05790 [Patescibacteria group bacterium]
MARLSLAAQKGSAHILAILAVIVVAAVGFVGYRVMNNDEGPASETSSQSSQVVPDEIRSDQDLEQAGTALDSEQLDSDLDPAQLDTDLNDLL